MALVCLPDHSVVIEPVLNPQEESKVPQEPSLLDMLQSTFKEFDEALMRTLAETKSKLKMLESELSQDTSSFLGIIKNQETIIQMDVLTSKLERIQTVKQ